MSSNLNNKVFHSSILVEATKAASWIWNVQTDELEVNERWAEIVGYKLEELKPINLNTWKHLMHPGDLKLAMGALNELFGKKSDFYSLEVRMLHKNGSWVWILDSGRVIEWSEKGRPLIAAGTHIDITKRKELQIRVEKNEQNLTQILENTKDIIYRLSLEGNFTYLSSAWNKLLGHDVASTIGTSFRVHVHPDDLPNLNSSFEIMKETGAAVPSFTYRLRHNNGSWQYFETSASPIRENSVVVGYAGVARDITNLIMATQELTRQKEELERFFTVSLDLLCILGDDGYFYMLNKAWETVLGFSIEYLKSKPISSFVHPDDVADTKKAVKSIISSGKILPTFVNRYRCYDGSYRYLEWKSQPYKNVIYGSARDITEEIENQKRIDYLIYHDHLTNLYNRRYLDKIVKEITSAQHLPLGIIVIDLNNLKGINDRFGHMMGDQVLVNAAKIISRNIPRGDCVFRMGGDEFLVLVEKSSEQELEKIKDDIRKDIIKSCTGECPLSLAYGSYLLEKENDSLFEEMKKADDDMYVDKQRSKANRQ